MLLTSVSIVRLIAGNKVPGGGASVPEHVVPREAYYEALANRGLNISTRWYEGHVNVTDLQPLQTSEAES